MRIFLACLCCAFATAGLAARAPAGKAFPALLDEAMARMHRGMASAERIGDPESFRELDGRRQVLGPRPLAVLAERQLEAADGAGHARRSPALDAVARQIAGRIEIHVARRVFRRALAEIDERRAAVREPDQHVAAAADVAGKRVRDGKGETDGHRGIDGVAPFLQDGDADVGGDRFHRDDHAVPGVHRLARRLHERRQRETNDDDRPAFHITADCIP